MRARVMSAALIGAMLMVLDVALSGAPARVHVAMACALLLGFVAPALWLGAAARPPLLHLVSRRAPTKFANRYAAEHLVNTVDCPGIANSLPRENQGPDPGCQSDCVR
jgi:hypothetical protein